VTSQRLSQGEEHLAYIEWTDLLYLRLRWGEPQTIGSLAESMNAPRRAIEKAVESLRASGAPVVTGSAGVWLSSDERELLAAYRALRKRAVGQMANARPLLRTARSYSKNRQLGFPW
jgi:biotin operon repressor